MGRSSDFFRIMLPPLLPTERPSAHPSMMGKNPTISSLRCCVEDGP
jgi:hypothetical protein